MPRQTPIVLKNPGVGNDYRRNAAAFPYTHTAWGGLYSYSNRQYTSYLGPKPTKLQLTPHGYSLNYQEISLKVQYSYTWGGGGHQYGSGPGLAANFSGATVKEQFSWNNVENDALSDLNEKTRGNLDLSVSAFQAKSTLQILRPVERVLDYTRKFTRAFRRMSVKEFVKTMSEARLEYVYGVKPTLEDIYNVLNRDPLINSDGFLACKGRGSDKSFTPRTLTVRATGAGGDFLHDFWFQSSFDIRVLVGVTLATRAHNPGHWTSLNPASILWELTPYSFVADWFLDVGSYLRNLETGYLYSNLFKVGYRTRQVKGVGKLSTPDNFWEGHYRVLDVNRALLSSYPLPNSPRLKVELGSGRLLNAAALLGVLLKSK